MIHEQISTVVVANCSRSCLLSNQPRHHQGRLVVQRKRFEVVRTLFNIRLRSLVKSE
jgi:hypothetical protein